MRLGGRKPGSAIVFIDAHTQETLLQVASGDGGLPLIAFHLYNEAGELVSDSGGYRSYPEGLDVVDAANHLLLHLPNDYEAAIHYCLYNSCGSLLTHSDGLRTQICGALRVESAKFTEPALAK